MQFNVHAKNFEHYLDFDIGQIIPYLCPYVNDNKRDMKYIIDCSLVKDPGAVTRYVLKNVSYLCNPFKNQRRFT